MNEPSFWRTEIWHPLTLHFPITLLLLATTIKLASFLIKEKNQAFWLKAGSYLLYLGCITAWFSIYTGNLAESLVSRKICDPTVLKDHQIGAYNLAYFFTGATLLDLGQRSKLVKFRITGLTVTLLMLIGTGFLIYTSHLGARVVYQQAGGVQVPASDCAGFAD